MRILLAEDDAPVARFVRKGLEAEHYAVDVAADGEEAQFMIDEFTFDLLILDLNLPRADGLEVLKHARARRASLPILILTSRSAIEDRVNGLDMGADDYLSKPFSFIEVAARVRALLRRNNQPAEAKLQVADLELNRVERRITRAGRKIEMTQREFALLEYLMRNAGRCVTRAMIIEHVWNFTFDTMTNVVDVYINYLRKKIDRDFEPKLIHTIRGAGYQLGKTPLG